MKSNNPLSTKRPLVQTNDSSKYQATSLSFPGENRAGKAFFSLLAFATLALFPLLSQAQTWVKITGGLKHVSVGSDGETWGVNAKDQIFRYLGSNRWQLVGGFLKQISVGNRHHIWGVNSADHIYRFKHGYGWVRVAGGLKHVSVGSDGTVWGVNNKNMIYMYLGNNHWKHIGGNLVQISVGSRNHVWGVGYGNAPFKWVHGKGWVRIPGKVRYVSVASDGTVLAIGMGLRVYQYQNGWKLFGGSLLQVSVGKAGTYWGTGYGAAIYQRIDPVYKSCPGVVQRKHGSFYCTRGGMRYQCRNGQVYQMGMCTCNGQAPTRCLRGTLQKCINYQWVNGSVSCSLFQNTCTESYLADSVAHAIYYSGASLLSSLRGAKFQFSKVWNHGGERAHLVFRWHKGAQVCHYGFRGVATKSMVTWFNTFKGMGSAKNCTTLQGKSMGSCINQGFDRYVKMRVAILNDLIPRVQKGGCQGGLILSGHSMGGVLATLTAAELYTKNPKLFTKNYMRVFTYGSPRIFKRTDALKWANRIHVTRWIYKGAKNVDPVIAYPRFSHGFSHVGHSYIAQELKAPFLPVTLRKFTSAGTGDFPVMTLGLTDLHKSTRYVKALQHCKGL